jgi:hypothetical protein
MTGTPGQTPRGSFKAYFGLPAAHLGCQYSEVLRLRRPSCHELEAQLCDVGVLGPQAVVRPERKHVARDQVSPHPAESSVENLNVHRRPCYTRGKAWKTNIAESEAAKKI